MVIHDPSYPHAGLFRQTTPSNPRVVSIPVHFVRSEKAKSDSALKIQRAFRGYRVRKNLKKILLIQREVDLVEEKLQERETVELIKRDDKERLKMNESLMALLFKLDSVLSVSDAIRDCRKAAINKAIMLQERIDSFKNCDEIATKETNDDAAVDEGELKDNVDDSAVTPAQIPDTIDQPEAWECVVEETEEKPDFVEVNEAERCEGGNSAKRSSDEWFVAEGSGEESKRSKKLLEKMAEDNQKLMAMVAELCDRNAEQASLISLLSQRVEQLEKAMSDSLRKKKKKKKNVNGLTHTRN